MVSNTYLTLPTVARYLRIDHRTLRSLARRGIVSCDWLTATFTLGGKKGSKPIFLVASLERVRDDPDIEPGGAHGAAVDVDLFTLDTAWVAWVNHDVFDVMTATFTHELVETITDPEPSSGWTVPGKPSDPNEIVDVCNPFNGPVVGYAVSAYYSDRLKAYTRFDGRTATTIASNCFQGVYGWTLWSTHRRVVIDADVSSYVQPEITRPESGVNIFQEIAEPEEKRAG